MRSIVYANLPQTLSNQPFVEFLYQHDECLKTFSEELVSIFHQFLDSHLEIQSYMEDRIKDVEELSTFLEREEVITSLKELVAEVSTLVEMFSSKNRRLVDIQLQFPNTIRMEIIECQDLLLGLNMMAID